MFVCFVFFQNCSTQLQSNFVTSSDSLTSAVPVKESEVESVHLNETADQVAAVQNRTIVDTTRSPRDESTTTIPRQETLASNQNDQVQPETPYDLNALIGYKSGEMVGRAQIIVASTDQNKNGHFLFILNFQNQTFILDPAINKWVAWDRKLTGYRTPSRTLISTQGYGDTLIHSLDMTPFGGGRLSVGYGVGESIVAAVTECFDKNRLKEVFTIPIQEFSALPTIPIFRSTIDKVHTVNVFVHPKQSDYGLFARYYIFAKSPDGEVIFFSNGKWTSSAGQNLNLLYHAELAQSYNLNVNIKMTSIELGALNGWNMFAGYGLDFEDMQSRSLISRPVKIFDRK